MKILIELLSGPKGSRPVTQQEIQANIDTLEKVIDVNFNGSLTGKERQSIADTKSIIEGIQGKLPRG